MLIRVACFRCAPGSRYLARFFTCRCLTVFPLAAPCPPPTHSQEGDCFKAAAALDTHKALVHIFFAQRSTKKIRGAHRG